MFRGNIMRLIFALFLVFPLLSGCNSARVDQLESKLDEISQHFAETQSDLVQSRRELEDCQLNLRAAQEGFERDKEQLEAFKEELKKGWQAFREGYDPSLHGKLQENVEATKQIVEMLTMSKAELTSKSQDLQSHMERLRTVADQTYEQHRVDLEKSVMDATNLLEKCRKYEAEAKDSNLIGKMEADLGQVKTVSKTAADDIDALRTKLKSVEQKAQNAMNKAQAAYSRAFSR